MKKMMKRTLAFVLTLAMCFAFVPSVMAAEGEDPGTDTQQVNKIDKSKTADVKVLDRDKPETEITLSVPGEEYQNKVDVVFVMDDSSSISNSNINFRDNLIDLFDSVVEKNKGVELKIGIVKFSGYAMSMLGNELIVYNGTEEDKENIEKAIELTPEPEWHGSNPHSGLIKANELLEADDLLENTHKYVVFLTDGKGYIWNNEKNEPVTYYAQYIKKNGVQSGGKPYLNQLANSYNREQGSGYWQFQQEGLVDHRYIIDGEEIVHSNTNYDSSDYYQVLFDLNTDELKNTEGTYDCPAYYTRFPGYTYSDSETLNVGEGSVETIETLNGAELFKGSLSSYQKYYKFSADENTVWNNINYLQLKPYEVLHDDGNYYYNTNQVNEAFWLLHPDSLQKGLYLTGHYWSEVINHKYNTAVIGVYNTGSGSGTHPAGSFTHWLAEGKNCDIGVQIDQAGKKEAVSAEDIERVAGLFSDIDNSIRYTVGSGVVTDQITGPFDLVTDAYGNKTKVPFKMVVGKDDAEDKVEYIAAPVEGEENKWTFGEELKETDPETGDETVKYPYTVSWDGKDTFTWTINVPVENAKPVHLSYKLRWKEDRPFTGKYELTNAKTTLDYKNSLGEDQKPEDFKSPEVLAPLKVFYDANGGNGIMVDDKAYEAGEITLKENAFTRSGYTFSGWSTIPDGEVLPDEPYDLTADTTFYAIWTRNSNPPTPPTPPIDIDDPDVPLDLNGADHFAYIEGYPDGTVQPGGNITRAEVSTMIYRLLTEDRRAEIFTDQNGYSDVEKANWFNKAVSSMTEGKYVTGYPDGTFLPNQAITRAEFVTIVVRFLDGMKESENPFSDIDGHWAKDYILSAVDAGWIDGYPDGTFQPNKAITRAEAMKIMNTILHRGVNETSELGEPVMFPDNSDASQWYYYEVIEATNDHETEGERPDEQWKSNTIDYTYDIVKYERP